MGDQSNQVNHGRRAGILPASKVEGDNVGNYWKTRPQGNPNKLLQTNHYSYLALLQSYYLLDGATYWIAKRTDDLTGRGAQTKQLGAKLREAQSAIQTTRDELDDNAQHYLRSLARINELKCDITKNIDGQLQTCYA